VRLPVLLRRPLLLLLVLGCGVSTEVSGRFSLRLVVDGMISFAFVPIAEIGSLALVWEWNGRPLPFARAVDMFCQSDSPWLLWVVAVAALRALESPLQAVSTAAAVWYFAGATLVAVAVRAAQLDLRLFCEVLAPARPVRALAVQRLVAWTCALGYFLGIAIWPNIVGFVRG
jgi:hypothetical protein